jgi:RNA-directed DNA polymerase
MDWRSAEKQVKRLQMRIAKAIQEGRHGKAKALQWLLTHSFYGKLLAVKRVTENRGAKTPGVDGVIWKTTRQKEDAVKTLKRRGYKAQPLRRIYIVKSNKKLRPLGIPTKTDRAQQALCLLGLEPFSEQRADKNAYGFRPKRSAADAIEACFQALSRRTSAQWVLEGDIKSCFDRIDHFWLLANVPMDKVILQQWLKAGYMEKRILHSTIEGTPQGGIISPCLAVFALSGLEQAAKKAALRADKVNVVAYADDFIVTGASKEVLENKIKPAITAFLKERGLELSEEKTKISHIEKGFDFLGFNVRKYKGKLLIKPAKKSVKRFLDNIRRTISSNISINTGNLIGILNPKIVGWSNYFRYVVSKKTFSDVDSRIFDKLMWWIKRRHPNKNAGWRHKNYFRREGLRNWIFYGVSKSKNGKSKLRDLRKASAVPIQRHVKIQAAATPHDPKYRDYFAKRKAGRECKMSRLIQKAVTQLGIG